MNTRAISHFPTKKSMFHVFILLVFIPYKSLGSYQIIFDKEYSPPPKIPPTMSMYYSVPLNEEISKPIIAYFVCSTGKRVIEGPLLNAVVKVYTISVNTAADTNIADEWKNTGGTLCQTAVPDKDYPERLDRSKVITRCGSTPDKTVLSVQAIKGKIILDGLSHHSSSVPKHARVLRIVCYSPYLTADTYPFLITIPADRLKISSLPPHKSIANHPFSLEATILDKSGLPVTSGLDSIAYVNLLVPYYYKTFYNTKDRKMMLKNATVRLLGSTKDGGGDEIIRKRASKGVVIFDRIRILDSNSNLQLNLTMTMARFPWTRIPNCATCYDDVTHITLKSNDTEVTFPDLGAEFYKKIKPMVLTKPIKIVPQIASYIELDEDTFHEWKKWTDPKNNRMRIARNTRIPGNFSIHLCDTDAERIYSGPGAYNYLIYTTIPPGVCVSNDATKKIEHGHANIHVSICQPIKKMKLRVTIHQQKAIKVETPYLEVEETLQIVHLGNFNKDQGIPIESGIDNFISAALVQINKRFMNSTNQTKMRFNLISIDTTNKVKHAIEAFQHVTDITVNPLTSVQGIISSTTEEITFALNPQITAMHIPYISTENSAKVFSDKEFPYVHRVCWSEESILTSVMHVVKERNWMLIIILREAGVALSRTLRETIKHNDINIEKEVIFSDTLDFNSTDSDTYFRSEMNEIASSNCRIFFLFANNKMQKYILRAAYLKGLDTDHGYQWVLIGRYLWEFPFRNLGVCARGPKTCTEAFRGTLLIGETYDVNANHKRWIRVLDEIFATDNYKRQIGIVEYQSLGRAAKEALGYDATLLLTHCIRKLVTKRLTLTGTKVNDFLQHMRVHGLTGSMQLTPFGDRIGYLGFLAQVHPLSYDIIYLRLLIEKKLTKLIEVPFENSLTNLPSTAEIILPTSHQYNIITYNSYTGIVSLATHEIIENPAEQWPSVKILRNEKVLPSFICSQKCGLSSTNISDVTIYNTGKCIKSGGCQCKSGYAGEHCTIASCHRCINGKCARPDVCTCYSGWRGISCNKAHCDSCVEGSCDSPGKCTCFAHAIGKNCSTHVAALAVPLIVGLILLFVLIYFGVKKILAHSRQKSALNNTDWEVDWSTVQFCQEENSLIRRTSARKQSRSLLTSERLETYKWKNERWYVKYIPNSSINRDDVKMRLEMVMLTQIKHINLIRYGGACLTCPHVSLFLEVAHKGSLNDVLRVKSLGLGWEFRYSFMKDICSGMRFLHEETQIGSHGRLTSYNCLIDNHWTIKISGFGVPSIRFGKYRQPRDEGLENFNNLFWTSPELLVGVNSLDEIKKGTPYGDVYSFSIIMTEILTSAEPYEFELEYISGQALLALMKDPLHPDNSHTLSKWKEIGGLDMLTVRPILLEEHFGSQMMRRIVAEAWDSVPASRPSFRKLHLMLEESYPVTGGLMDNLINLLSSYSNNLEMIVMERTKEMEKSKEKSEHLLRQLLPSIIVDELKMGRKVAPELFECVTVFFSDIVDFTEILIESTPFQMVNFLNDIYNVFDNTIVKYDVYKVETICDTYVVVSGLPQRIGCRHAGEVATMSLHLLSLVTEFKIKHRPNATLQLRIGIHSGSVVAGIVGVMMPRYCLFGDTVNTASRMQTSSMSLHIQVSEATDAILKELGGYHLVTRGMREIKGRGLMCTYWLNGKDDFHRVLPDKSLAISLSRHRFK